MECDKFSCIEIRLAFMSIVIEFALWIQKYPKKQQISQL